MWNVLNIHRHLSKPDNTGFRIQINRFHVDRLKVKVDEWFLLYEPTRDPRPRGYIAAAQLTSVECEGENSAIASFLSDMFFMFAAPVPFKIGGKRVEMGLHEDGGAGVAVREVSVSDARRIISRGYGGEDRIPYALLRVIESGENPFLSAAEDD